MYVKHDEDGRNAGRTIMLKLSPVLCHRTVHSRGQSGSPLRARKKCISGQTQIHQGIRAKRACGIFEISDCEGRNEDQRLKEGSRREWQIGGEPAKSDCQKPQDPHPCENETSEDNRTE